MYKQTHLTIIPIAKESAKFYNKVNGNFLVNALDVWTCVYLILASSLYVWVK